MGSINFEVTLTDLGQGKQLPFAAGSYNIFPISADLIVESDVFTKMDPFVTIDFKGAEQAKTKTAQGAGKAPKWTEKLTF